MELVVAYRDSGNFYRSKQLSVFVDQMKSIFDPLTNLTITIIEQESHRDDYDKLPKITKVKDSDMAKFNLGRLKNIGYKLTKNKKNNTLFYQILILYHPKILLIVISLSQTINNLFT